MISAERLQYVPEQFREQHSFCFWLHYMMLDILRQAEAARVADVSITFADEEERQRFEKADSLFSFLYDAGHLDILKRIALNQVVIPLYGDLLHFVFEGLRALEERKYAVAFTLFRKPFKYSLMFATWLFADEDDFFARLSTEPADSFDERRISAEQRVELLQRAISRIDDEGFLDAAVIASMAFDRKNDRGLAQYFDKAAHLVTSHPSMRTEALNLNFIFKDPRETDVYEGVYHLLAYLLMYLLRLELATIAQMKEVPSWYSEWIKMATLATHVSLFTDGGADLLNEINQVWKESLDCVLCQGKLAITRENVLTVFSYERITCPKCASEQQIPIYWLMSHFARLRQDTAAQQSDE